jgi:hypothetical protein
MSHAGFMVSQSEREPMTTPTRGRVDRFAAAAVEAGCDVFLYCIDDAVAGVRDPDLQALKSRGVRFYACAYGAHQRHLPVDDSATFAGLTVVSDLVASTDRFVSFN